MDRAVIGIHGRRKPMLRRIASATVAMLSVVFLCVPPASAVALPTPEGADRVPRPGMLQDQLLPAAGHRAHAAAPQPGARQPAHRDRHAGPREQLCVPVAKNNQQPPSPALDFIRFIDLACYRISGATVTTGLVLSHLNPLFQGYPRTQVSLKAPRSSCACR